MPIDIKKITDTFNRTRKSNSSDCKNRTNDKQSRNHKRIDRCNAVYTFVKNYAQNKYGYNKPKVCEQVSIDRLIKDKSKVF